MIARLCPEVDGIAMLVCKPMAVVCKPTVRHVGLQTNAKCLQNKVSFQIIGNIDFELVTRESSQIIFELVRLTLFCYMLDIMEFAHLQCSLNVVNMTSLRHLQEQDDPR